MAAEHVVAGILFAALWLYTMTGGADFGGGVWDAFAMGPRKEAQRRVIARAIGPIWEANHVWLILVIVLLFTCFPVAFARIGIALHWPLTLLLIGIVLRGSALVFRAYDSRVDAVQARWSRVFAGASLFAPVMLGISTGAVASGALTFDADGTYTGGFFAPWLAPFPIATGLFTLSLFALLAAVQLVNIAQEPELREDFRVRGLGAALAVFLTAWATWLAAWRDAPELAAGLVGSPLAWTMQLVTAALGVALVTALWRRRFRIARLLAFAQVTALLLGWGANQWPWMLVGSLTIEQAAAPEHILWGTVGVLGVGAVPLVAAYAWMLSIFQRQRLSGAPSAEGLAANPAAATEAPGRPGP